MFFTYNKKVTSSANIFGDVAQMRIDTPHLYFGFFGFFFIFYFDFLLPPFLDFEQPWLASLSAHMALPRGRAMKAAVAQGRGFFDVCCV